MKFHTLLTITIIIQASLASAAEWKITGKQTSAKESASVVIAQDPKLMLKTSVNDDHLVISFSDGKQKFGSSVISFQKGDITYKRPRLKLAIPLKKAKAVTAQKPLVVTAFKHKTTEFEIHLVHGSGSNLPDVVIIKK